METFATVLFRSYVTRPCQYQKTIEFNQDFEVIRPGIYYSESSNTVRLWTSFKAKIKRLAIRMPCVEVKLYYG